MDKFDEATAPLDYDCPECGVAAGKRCRKLVSKAWTKAKRERGPPAGNTSTSIPTPSASPMRGGNDALAGLKERKEFIGDTDLVFTREGEHLAFGSAAITKLDPHSVQSYMGHQHYSTTQRYLHHRPRRDDAAKLDEAFESLSDKAPKTGSGLPK